MTALNFCLTENRLLLSMDTLVSDNETDKKPLLFTTKTFILPHMNCLICGVGTLDVVFEWYEFVARKVVAEGILSLDSVAQRYLYSNIPDNLKNAYCTIYQFGINEIDGKMDGFVYRHENNYISKKLEHAVYTRPEIPNDIDIKFTDVYQYFSDIMKYQKKINDSSLKDDRIYIGGTIQILEMTKNKIQIINYDNFDDYNECLDQIKNRLV